MKLKPLGDRLIVRAIDEEETQEITLPGAHQVVL